MAHKIFKKIFYGQEGNCFYFFFEKIPPQYFAFLNVFFTPF